MDWWACESTSVTHPDVSLRGTCGVWSMSVFCYCHYPVFSALHPTRPLFNLYRSLSPVSPSSQPSHPSSFLHFPLLWDIGSSWRPGFHMVVSYTLRRTAGISFPKMSRAWPLTITRYLFFLMRTYQLGEVDNLDTSDYRNS